MLLSINFSKVINSREKYAERRLSKLKVASADIISTFPLCLPKTVSTPHKATK